MKQMLSHLENFVTQIEHPIIICLNDFILVNIVILLLTALYEKIMKLI